jgi:phosphoribosylanthranilate isomerase
MPCIVKICGITRRSDLELIAREGADYGGVIVGIPQSPRNLTLEAAKVICENSPLPIVNLTFNKTVEENVRMVDTLSPTALQLQGKEAPAMVAALRKQVSCELWKALHMPPREEGTDVDLEAFLQTANAFIEAGVDKFIIDASAVIDGVQRYGGTGKTVDWKAACAACTQIPIPVLLAGGITPENVAEAMQIVQPYGVDLSSGVEIQKGIKDAERVRSLIQRAKL